MAKNPPSLNQLSRLRQELRQCLQIILIITQQLSRKQFILLRVSPGRFPNIDIELRRELRIKERYPRLDLMLLLGLAWQHHLIRLLLVGLEL